MPKRWEGSSNQIHEAPVASQGHEHCRDTAAISSTTDPRMACIGRSWPRPTKTVFPIPSTVARHQPATPGQPLPCRSLRECGATRSLNHGIHPLNIVSPLASPPCIKHLIATDHPSPPGHGIWPSPWLPPPGCLFTCPKRWHVMSEGDDAQREYQ
jgi:hypothetical protein